MPIAKTKKLTPKQERFCQEYMIDLNATAAAKRAGYSKKTAFTIGTENLRKPLVAEKIKGLKQGIAHSTDLTVAKVVGGFEKIAFGSIGKHLNNGHKQRALDSLGRHLGLFEKDNEQKKLTLADIAALAGINGND